MYCATRVRGAQLELLQHPPSLCASDGEGAQEQGCFHKVTVDRGIHSTIKLAEWPVTCTLLPHTWVSRDINKLGSGFRSTSHHQSGEKAQILLTSSTSLLILSPDLGA